MIYNTSQLNTKRYFYMHNYNPVAIQKLVDELRKQDGNQCFDSLVDTSGPTVCYCAEGVMTKVYAEHFNLELSIKNEAMLIKSMTHEGYDELDGLIIEYIDCWFSKEVLSIPVGEYNKVCLVTANDNFKLSLGQIADKLEAKYLTFKE